MTQLPPEIRSPELYEGMTLEQILRERQNTLAKLERLLEYVTLPETAARLGVSIIATKAEIESVKQCMEV